MVPSSETRIIAQKHIYSDNVMPSLAPSPINPLGTIGVANNVPQKNHSCFTKIYLIRLKFRQGGPKVAKKWKTFD